MRETSYGLNVIYFLKLGTNIGLKSTYGSHIYIPVQCFTVVILNAKRHLLYLIPYAIVAYALKIKIATYD